MRLLLPVLRNRQRRRAAERRSSLLTPGFIASLVFSFIFLLLAASAAFFFWYITRDLPNVELLPGMVEPPDGMIYHPTQLFDRTGKNLLFKLENPAGRGFTYLPLDAKGADHLPDLLGKSTIIVVDPEFLEHSGYKWRLGEAPTIPEQVVSKFLLWYEPAGWRRELRIKILAGQIVSRYGRERILEWYLNSANYGRLAYGADAAARVYFGKSASKITLAEAALLAVTAQAPALNPQDNPHVAWEHAQKALAALVTRGWITTKEEESAINAPPIVQPALPVAEKTAPAFIQSSLKQLVDQFGWERLERGGMVVITTLDQDIQTQVTCTSQWTIQHMQGRPADTPQDCIAAHLLPPLPEDSNQDRLSLAGDAVVLDSRKGQVLALFSEHPSTWESSLNTGRPAGSLLTPFVYMAAFTRGFNPASLVWDLPPSGEEDVTDVEIRTYDGPMRARMALVNDELTVAENIFQQIGAELVWKTARQMGVYLPGERSSADSIQLLRKGGQVSLLEITHAYATLANQGVQAGQVVPNPNLNKNPEALLNLSPSFILKVTDQAGKVWLDWSEPKTRPVLPPALSYLITDILSDETARWKTYGHPNPMELGRPAAVKTGKTQSGRDVWAVGYTPGLTVGVWLGSQGDIQQGRIPETAAAPLWNAILAYGERQRPLQSWEVPSGISRVEVCDPSGLLPTQSCPNIVREVFLSGSEPTQADNLFFSRQINRETGNLATIYTDLDFIEEKSYLRIPEGGEDWAIKKHLPQPPPSYDILYHHLIDGDADAIVTNPRDLELIRGKVEIRGTAGGKDFSSYRIQIGQGLNPNRWWLIGEDHKASVRDGILETWDTSGLNGLYVIQLLVVDKNGRLKLTTTQVTVDNIHPDVKIAYPIDGSVVKTSEFKKIPFHVTAQDEIGLKSVVFFLDEKEIANLTQPPFTYAWGVELGLHKLVITGYDMAGNDSTTSIQFNVED